MPRIHDVTIPLVPGMTNAAGEASADPRRRLTLSMHTGTHVDAPAQFLEGGATVDELPLEILLGKARVIEVLARERVDRADLETLDLRDDLRVLLKTRLAGHAVRGAHGHEHAWLSEDAALYLVQAGIKLVGFDYLSIDREGSAEYPAHRTLLGAGVILVEGLELAEVEPGEYEMACLPLRVAGGDAAPARVVLRSRG